MSTVQPVSPYKGLIPYFEEDAQFFFGRDQKCEIITSNLMASRLTLLHGASGVGKSSVLYAGVAYQLRQRALQCIKDGVEPDFAVIVFSSWRDDPVAALAARVHETVDRLTDEGELDPLPPSRDLSKALQTWTRRAPDEGKPDLDLLIILDQFEEYFLYHPTEKGDGTFATELPRAINNTDLRVNFLISIREDALAKLERFKGSLPTLFENRLSVEHLNQKAAREAIVKPLEQFNRLYSAEQPVSIEPQLVETILQQVETGQVFLGQSGRGVVEETTHNGDTEIETPFLQMVLTKLWEEERNNSSNVLRLETLNRLGGAARIVRTHLDQTMETLSPVAKDIAARMFFHLVTPSGTKIAHTVPDLATFAKVSEGELDPVLDKLADNSERILRPVDPAPNQPGVQRYEIFHDVLAPAVLDWRMRYMQEKNQAQAEKKAAEEAARKEQEAARSLKLQQAEELAEAQRARAEEQERRFEAERLRAEEQQLQVVFERRHSRQLKSGVVALATLLIASFAALGFAILQTNKASAARLVADQRTQDAVRFGELAQKARNEAIVDRSNAESQRKAAILAGEDAVRQKEFAETAREEAVKSKDYALKQKRIAETARTEEEKQKNIAESRRLAAEAFKELAANPEMAVVRAQDSIKMLEKVKGVEPKAGATALHAAVQALPERVRIGIGSEAGTILNVAMSVDGNRLVTYDPYTTKDRFLLFSDLTSGRPAIALKGEEVPVPPVGISANGELIVTGGQKGSLLLWDGSTGQLLSTSGESLKIFPVAFDFSTAGRLLVSGWSFEEWSKSRKRQAELLIVTLDGNKFGSTQGIRDAVFPKEGSTDPIRNLLLSPNGESVAFVKPGGTIELLNLATKKISQFECNEIPKPRSVDATLLAFNSTSQQFAVACTDGGVRLWDIGLNPEPIEKFRRNVYPLGDTPLTFSGDLKRLATLSSDFTVKVRGVWEESTGNAVADERLRQNVVSLIGHTGGILSSTFSPDGQKLITAGSDKHANIWTLGLSHELSTFSGAWSEVGGIDFSPKGLSLIGGIADTQHPTAEIWNIETGERVSLVGHTDKVWGVAYSQDGRFIATGGDSTVHLRDAGTGKTLHVFLHREPVRDRDVTAPSTQTSEARPAVVREVAFSRDGNLLAAVGDDGWARVWSTATKNQVQQFSLNAVACRANTISRTSECPQMRGVSFNHDGTRLATANADSTATVWDIKTGGSLFSLVGHSDIVWKVVYSPDGKLIATASHDATAIIWDAESGNELRTLSGHNGKLWGIAFSGDGKRIATASADKTARVWDVKTGEEVLILTGHTAGVNRVAFGANDRRLATSSEDATVRIYTLDIKELMDISQLRLLKLEVRQTQFSAQ